MLKYWSLMVKLFFVFTFNEYSFILFGEQNQIYGGYMNNVGSITVSTAIGAGIGGATAFVTAGPAGVVPGMKLGGTIGAQFGGVVKVEQGLDATSRKIDQIITDTSIKVGEGVDKVADSVDKAAKDIGLKTAEATSKAIDKLCDAGIKAISNVGKECTVVALAVYVIQGLNYSLKDSNSLYYDRCGAGSFSDLPCAMNTLHMASQYISMGIIGGYVVQRLKTSLKGK